MRFSRENPEATQTPEYFDSLSLIEAEGSVQDGSWFLTQWTLQAGERLKNRGVNIWRRSAMGGWSACWARDTRTCWCWRRKVGGDDGGQMAGSLRLKTKPQHCKDNLALSEWLRSSPAPPPPLDGPTFISCSSSSSHEALLVLFLEELEQNTEPWSSRINPLASH